jgi:hypothetical protein
VKVLFNTIMVQKSSPFLVQQPPKYPLTLKIAGQLNATLLGPAWGSTFLLAKTEIIDSETIVEEDYFAMAVEWGENNGAGTYKFSFSQHFEIL